MMTFDDFAAGCSCQYGRQKRMCHLLLDTCVEDDCLEVDCAAYYAYKTTMEELMPGTNCEIDPSALKDGYEILS